MCSRALMFSQLAGKIKLSSIICGYDGISRKIKRRRSPPGISASRN